MAKQVKGHSEKYFKVKSMFSDDLLVQLNTKQHRVRFIGLAKVQNHQVLITRYRSRNTVQGVISEIDQINYSESQFPEVFQDNGIVT